ncbi:MAG: hypothetical protein OXC96_02355 [Cyanobacteria bacterium MAG CAR1_bin_15]|nr:hypothetical protein [Cyanobacteria bacterium MAG CAR1_bin_15]
MSLRRIALRRVTRGDDGRAPLRWTGTSDGDGFIVEGRQTGARQLVTRRRMLMDPWDSGSDKGCMDFC